MIDIITSYDLGLIEQPIRVAYAHNRLNFSDLHKHDGFCEIYVLLKGALNHHINGSLITIQGPSIIFIRETDTHRFQPVTNQPCVFFLVIIHKDLYYNLRNFLSIPGVFSQIDKYKNSPIAPIPNHDYEAIQQLLINTTTNTPHTLMSQSLNNSTFLVNLFSYFLPNLNLSEESTYQAPSWFIHLCEQAEYKSIFTLGVPELIRLSGKSNPYLCKCFHKYLNKTPSSFINDIRLSYAKNLLTNTDMTILDVSLESGYDNLSHFYHLFGKKFHTTPLKCRQATNSTYL